MGGCATLWQVLHKARPRALTEVQVASPLARKPYGFRHAGVSWRLNAGTPATLVAEWAGDTVEVLYRIYAHCLDGDDERWFGRMEQALGSPATPTLPMWNRCRSCLISRRMLSCLASCGDRPARLPALMTTSSDRGSCILTPT
jgi:hypothetical protein